MTTWPRGLYRFSFIYVLHPRLSLEHSLRYFYLFCIFVSTGTYLWRQLHASCFSERVPTKATTSLSLGPPGSRLMTLQNKSSAVPEMGDCGDNRHGPKRGSAVPLSRSAGNPSNTMRSAQRSILPYQVASSSIHLLNFTIKVVQILHQNSYCTCYLKFNLFAKLYFRHGCP